MAGREPPALERQRRADREVLVRTLTFWLRPEFVLRVKVAGFDRAVALASGALTATILLAIIASAGGQRARGQGAAERIIDRYELTGGGAEAVRELFAAPSGTSTMLGLVGFLFLIVAVLSFSRAVQRLFEQTWELEPLSVRNSFNGLLWIGGLSVYLTVSGLLQAAFGRGPLELTASLLAAPLSAVFLIWSGFVLSAKRITRTALIPFGVIGAALLAVYSVGATVYVPHLFSTLATRYAGAGE